MESIFKNKKNILFLFLLLLAAVFLACLSTNYDYDFFARLIVGHRFIENGIFPYQDFLSYTPTHPWYDHEWGSGVVFYLILKYFGSIGIILFHAIMMWGTAFFIIKTQKIQRHAYPASLTFLMVFLILFWLKNSSPLRCQLFTFLFFSIFLYILEKNRIKTTRLVWLIPLMTVFWNNVHGGVVSGLGLVFMYILGAVIEKKPWQNLLGILTVSSASLIINPYGYKYLNFLFSAATMTRKYVVEWWSPFNKYLLNINIWHILFLVSAYIVSLVNIKKTNVTKFIVLTVTITMGFLHAKLVSLGLITCASLCYNDFVNILKKIKKILVPTEKSIKTVILLSVLTIPLFSPTAYRSDLNTFPLYEVEFLKLNNIKGNLVTNFGYGSYVTYKLYPDNLIYMDGRYEEVYNEKEFLVLRNYELAEPDWDNIVKNYNTDILMPGRELEIYDVLKNNPNWVHIFEGRKCGIFVKKGKEKTSYIEPEYDINYYRRTMFKGPFGVKK